MTADCTGPADVWDTLLIRNSFDIIDFTGHCAEYGLIAGIGSEPGHAPAGSSGNFDNVFDGNAVVDDFTLPLVIPNGACPGECDPTSPNGCACGGTVTLSFHVVCE